MSAKSLPLFVRRQPGHLIVKRRCPGDRRKRMPTECEHASTSVDLGKEAQKVIEDACVILEQLLFELRKLGHRYPARL